MTQREMGFGVRKTGVQILVLSLKDSFALGLSLDFSPLSEMGI